MPALLRTLPATLVATLGLASVPAPAAGADQEPASTDRPRIGLALSGGGARGIAHIGVLEALEEMRIPVDYIAGTSMGAVIGGLYASGMSTTELRAMLDEIDWLTVFTDDSPRVDRSFRRKRDDDLYLFDAKVGLNKGRFTLPAGFVQGQKLDLLYTKYALPVVGITDFDRLAIPYRAVATDISTGEPVILKGGNLASAMRASLSVPGVIAPVEIDDRLLVDGGIAMNLPVEVVQDMGADIVIAVDISTPLHTRDEIDSVVAITAQLTSFLTRKGTQEQLAKLGPRDVLVTADPANIPSVGFNRAAEAIPIGHDAMMARARDLEKLALPVAEYAAHRDLLAERGHRQTEPPVIDFVRVDNNSRVTDEVVEARLSGIETGKPLDTKAVESVISRVYGLQLFERVSYSLVDDEFGRTGLAVNVDERRWGPNYLQLGMTYSSTSDDDSRVALAVSYLQTALNSRGGELRSTLQAGDEPRLLFDFYQPLARDARFFIAPSLEFGSLLTGVYDDGNRLGEARARGGLFDIGGGREFGRWGEARLGYRRGKGDIKVVSGADDIAPEGRFDIGEVFGRFSIDTFDSLDFPRDGSEVRLEWLTSSDALGANDRFRQIIVALGQARTWGRYSVVGALDLELTTSGEAPIASQFRLGGFSNLSGFGENELAGQHAARAALIGFRRIGNFALLPIYGGVTAELGNVWQDRDDIRLHDALFAGSLWLGAGTPLGPVYVAYGRAEGGRSAFYLYLGRPF